MLFPAPSLIFNRNIKLQCITFVPSEFPVLLLSKCWTFSSKCWNSYLFWTGRRKNLRRRRPKLCNRKIGDERREIQRIAELRTSGIRIKSQSLVWWNTAVRPRSTSITGQNSSYTIAHLLSPTNHKIAVSGTAARTAEARSGTDQEGLQLCASGDYDEDGHKKWPKHHGFPSWKFQPWLGLGRQGWKRLDMARREMKTPTTHRDAIRLGVHALGRASCMVVRARSTKVRILVDVSSSRIFLFEKSIFALLHTILYSSF